MDTASFAAVVAAHALIRGIARIGHGRGFDMHGFQAAFARLLFEVLAAGDAAVDALMGIVVHGVAHPFIRSGHEGARIRRRGCAA